MGTSDEHIDSEQESLSSAVQACLHAIEVHAARLAASPLDPEQAKNLAHIREEVDRARQLEVQRRQRREAGQERPHRLPQRSAPSRAIASAKVLLAEDNQINQNVIRRLLERMGHHVRTAKHGREALEMTVSGNFDIVLMDVHMPVMDGLEAMRRIRTELPAGRHPWLVALTGAVLPQDQESCREAGADDFLAKPVRLEELQQAVSRALNASARQALRPSWPTSTRL